jgi:hypothetical protein
LHLTKGEQSRKLFEDLSGQVAPLWERSVGIGSSVVLMLALVAGLVLLFMRRRRDVPWIVLAIIGSTYPATLVFRLSNASWEVGNRSSEFVFFGLGAVVAYGFVVALRRLGQPAWLIFTFTVALCVVYLGGAISGWPPPWRIPGPYLASSDTRSVENHGIDLALWARDYLPVNTIVGADRTNSDLLATLAHDWPSSTLNNGADVPFVIYSPHFGREEKSVLAQAHIRYLIVDRRLVRPPFASRTYIEFPNLTNAIIDHAKAKFNHLSTVDRVYDNGDIRVYDVSRASSKPDR